MRRTETGEEKNHTQLGGMINQRTYWECGTGKTIYGHRRDGNTGHGEYRSDSTLPPPPERCVPHRTPSNGEGEGRSGGLKGHGDRTGQEASRAAPVLGAMAGQGTREAMADPGTREAMAEQGAREAMAEQGAREAMAEQGAWEAMVGPPPRPRPQPPPRSLRPEPYYPPKISLGKIGAPSGTWGCTGGMDSWVRSGSADSWGHLAGTGT